MTYGTFFLIGLHALIAWILIEVFVNMAHSLSRATYLLWHYFVVVMAFAGLFTLFFLLFETTATPFEITLVGMLFVLFLELVVFRFLYSGERWFLNWVDWIFPIFLATTTIYVTASLW
ncbi:hypothetical protein HQ487_00690 [Candidatus Uhrbacteria bacterium]|nr:hypothetical protein [Candidatus Uhrbacteria bacterium]